MTVAIPRMKKDKVCETTPRDEWRAKRKAQREKENNSWENGFRHLKRYCQDKGDCLVPYAYRAPTSHAPKPGFALGKWVSEQRDNKFMLPSRRKLLNDLGLEWDQYAVGIFRFCPKQEIRQEHLRDISLREDWITWIVNNFKSGRCVFGSLIYPRKPHLTDIQKSVRIYAEQVMRRSCKSHHDPLRRVFVAEHTSGEDISKGRVRLIPKNGKIDHLLIKQPQPPETPVRNGMPEIPHLHFLMEVPKGCKPADFVELCEERWFNMNKKDRNLTSQLARVELVTDLPRVANYITKEYVVTQGQNIILTHATVLS